MIANASCLKNIPTLACFISVFLIVLLALDIYLIPCYTSPVVTKVLVCTQGAVFSPKCQQSRLLVPTSSLTLFALTIPRAFLTRHRCPSTSRHFHPQLEQPNTLDVLPSSTVRILHSQVFGRLVEIGKQVLTEVVLILEAPFAVGAVRVHVAVVLLKLCMVVEILSIIRFVCDVR